MRNFNNEFRLAYTLTTVAAQRLRRAEYGATTAYNHPYGDDIILTANHKRTPTGGHKLVLIATYRSTGETAAAIEVTADETTDNPMSRIVKVQAGELMFHNIPGTKNFRGRGRHTYDITPGTKDHPHWTVNVHTAGGNELTRTDPVDELVEWITAAEAA